MRLYLPSSSDGCWANSGAHRVDLWGPSTFNQRTFLRLNLSWFSSSSSSSSLDLSSSFLHILKKINYFLFEREIKDTNVSEFLNIDIFESHGFGLLKGLFVILYIS